jgi:glycosyltransferase involved in cell wall biosynthesis
MPEIWGIVVNEAMSAGKPVIVTTAVGCSSDLVKHGVNGYIIPEKMLMHFTKH